MIKKIFVLIFFFLIPFKINSSLIYAQTPTPEPEEVEERKSGWEQFWDDFLNLIVNINSSLNWFIPKKNVQISCDKQTNFTDYNADNQNSNSRAQSNASQKYRKGTYLKAILDGTYDDDTIAYLCNNVCTNSKTDNDNCIDIKYSTLTYYFYQKGTKILYDKSDQKTPIDYDSTKMESYNYTIPQGTDSYFENLYNNISQIPQGAYHGEANTAAGSSSELNGSLRTFLPASSQTPQPSPNPSSTNSTEVMIKDNEYQQRALYSNFIPAESQKVLGATTNSLDSDGQILGISTDTDTLKKIFTNDLHPASWQEDNLDFVEREDYDSNWDGYGGGTSTGTCNAKKSHCRGMSQYGALGLSQSGKNYEEILKFYYGSDTKIKKINTSNTNIKVNMTDPDNCPDGSSLNVEDYLRGLGEMPDYWGKVSKGGFQAMKAQVVAARTYAYMRTQGFTKAICNSSKCQVFKCSNIGKKPYLDKAIAETEGQILVDASSDTPFTTEYARSFCGPSKTVVYSNHTINSVNGYEYELKARNGQQPFCK